MQLTKPQLIIVGVAGFIIVFFTLVFLGFIPGLRDDIALPRVELNVWGVGDELKVWQEVGSKFEALHSNVQVKYTKLDVTNYEKQLVNALAAGTGPDVFMFHNTWLLKHSDKVIPVTEEKLPLATFRNFFPTIAEQDFVRNSKIYALPISIDTLALIYNRDIFDNKKIAVAPTTWDELKNTVVKVRELDSRGAITKSALAIGGTSKSVNNAADILSLLFLQFKTDMVSPDKTRAAIANNQGIQAVNFYTQFAKPSSFYYTWTDSFKPSINSLTSKQTAMILGYASEIPDIKAKNPALNFGVAPAPQFDKNNAVNFPSYWGLAVSSKTTHTTDAWDFIILATTNAETARNYVTLTSKPPALRFLINEYLNSPTLGTFAAQALTAKSWPQADNSEIKKVFDTMIESVVSGKLTTENALLEAEVKVSALMVSI